MSAQKIVKSPFNSRIAKVQGTKNFDKFYINYDIKKVVKKIGDAETDYVIQSKIIEKKDSVYELINSQAAEVGVYNILKKVAMTGDDSIYDEYKAPTGETITDITKVPENVADMFEASNVMLKAFASLPGDLVKGRNFAQFCETITQAEFDAWYTAIAQIKEVKKVKEEVNNG